MNSLLPLLKFSAKHSPSYSVLIDIYQIYVRNFILFCTGLSMVRVLFGEIIVCQNTVNSLTQTYIDTKCFINGTMTREDDAIIYHDYYQWVSVYLLLLAFGFYLPYSIWLKYFGHYINRLENLAEKPNDVIQIIRDTKGNLIFFKTLALEFFYLIYLFFVLFLTNVFFNRLWSLNDWSLTAVYKIFPDMGFCFFEYNHSSGISEGKFNCLLPLCSIYRKIFVSLYFMALALIVVSISVVAYHSTLALRNGNDINVRWAFAIVNRNILSLKVKQNIKNTFKEATLLEKENVV